MFARAATRAATRAVARGSRGRWTRLLADGDHELVGEARARCHLAVVREARQQLTTTLTRRIQHCSFTGHATVTAMKEYRRRHSLEPMGNVTARGAPLLTEGPSATSSTTDKAPSPQGPKPTPADKFANPLPVAVV